LPFSSSSWRSRFISDGIKPAYFSRQLCNVAWLIPALRQTWPTAVPSSACHRMKAICTSVNFDRFMVLPRLTARISHAAKLEFFSNLRSRKLEAGQTCRAEIPFPSVQIRLATSDLQSNLRKFIARLGGILY
jgi:hypothetical protein